MRLLLRTLGSATTLLLLAASAGAVVLVPDARGPERAGPPPWREYRSVPGRFRVLLPEAPRVSRSRYPTLAGALQQVRYASEVGDARVQVEHHDLPRLMPAILARSILSRAADGLVEKESARELEREELEWQGHPGVSLRYAIPDPDHRIKRSLLVLVGRRLYIVFATWPADAPPRPELAQLFNSFEILRP
jgi:hypothetical protein